MGTAWSPSRGTLSPSRTPRLSRTQSPGKGATRETPGGASPPRGGYMTANAGKDADGKSGRYTGAGGKGGTGKKTSAANTPPTDEVTVKKTDGKDNGAEPADKAEDTVVDLAAKKDGTEDTVMDLKLPPKKPDPPGDAAGSKDRLVSRGSTGDGSAKEKPNTGEPGSASGKTTSMDIPKTS